MAQPTTDNSNTVNVVTNVNTPNNRGSGTVLMFVFFWWALLIWWQVLAAVWVVWLLVAAVVTIFKHDFFGKTWYYPWPIWLFGIR